MTYSSRIGQIAQLLVMCLRSIAPPALSALHCPSPCHIEQILLPRPGSWQWLSLALQHKAIFKIIFWNEALGASWYPNKAFFSSLSQLCNSWSPGVTIKVMLHLRQAIFGEEKPVFWTPDNAASHLKFVQALAKFRCAVGRFGMTYWIGPSSVAMTGVHRSVAKRIWRLLSKAPTHTERNSAKMTMC